MAVSFKNLEDMLSGPGDLWGSRFSNKFLTPSTSMFNSGISGTRSPSMRGNSVISSLVKTDEKLLFKTLAFALSSVYLLKNVEY